MSGAAGAAEGGAAGAADNAGAAAGEDGGTNYEEPTNVRGGAGTAGAADNAGAGEGAGGEGEGEGTSGDAAADKGGKRTLVGDLQAERGKNKELAQQLEEHERFIDQWRPILQRLDGRPDLQQAVLDGRVTVAQAEATRNADNEAELREIAEDLDYYERKADGTFDYTKPDLKRAERYRTRHQKWAGQAADQKVQPIARQTAEQRAISAIDVAVAYCEQHQHADPAFVREELTKAAQKHPQALLDPAQGNALYELVVGRALMRGKAYTPGSKAGKGRAAAAGDAGDRNVVVTESAGGAGGPRLTAAERQLGEQYGLTEKDWNLAEQHAGIRRGYSRLEE